MNDRWIRLALAGVALAVVAATVPSPPSESYSIKAATARLRKISNALLLYRQEYGFVEASKRKSFSDAGMPPTYRALTGADSTGKPWHLTRSDFRVPRPVSLFEGAIQHYLIVWPAPVFEKPDLDQYYASRGDDMPVVVDVNMNPSPLKFKQQIKALVLRWNGKIDLVVTTWSSQFPRNFLEE